MWEKLKRLQEARTFAREGPARYSPLYVVVESATRYLDLSGTWQQLLTVAEETRVAFEDLLGQEEANPDHDPQLLDLVENTLDVLEGLSQAHSDDLPEVLRQLEWLDEQLQSFDLRAVYQRLLLQRERRELLQEVESQFSDEQLEAGTLQQIIAMCDQLVHAGGDPEEALDYLEEIRAQLHLRLEGYEQTPLREEEWTLEVALADDWMQQGYQLWFQALEGLSQSSLPPVDEEAVLYWLERLRQGNRYWLLVERLAQVLPVEEPGK